MTFDFDKTLTLGELVERLEPYEAILAEFPDGKNRWFNRYSRLDKSDAELPIVKTYEYDEVTKTFNVKISTLEMYLSPKLFKLDPGPITLGDICKDLGRDEKMIVEFPNGLTKTYHFYSDFRHLDDEQFLVESCEYDCPSKTYHVKVLKKYKPGFCEGSQGSIEASKVKEHIRRSLNSYYGLDPISHMRDIKELYGKNLQIKRIICDGPATIIFWNDGDKTVVKAQDEVDIEKGILYAALKKLATKKEYDNILRAIDKVDETCKDDPIKSIRDNLFPDRTLSPDEAEEFTKKETPKKTREHKYQKCPVCGRGYNLNYYRTNKLSKQGFVDIRCSKCDTLFRVKGNMSESKWHTKLEHDVLIKGGKYE